MSGMNPNNRFVSPTDDMNRAGAEGTINVNVVGNMNEIANRTTDRLFQVVSESPQSSELIVSSRSRTRGTPFNFTSDIGGPLYRGRTARLTAAIVPALPNINRSNNQVQMQFLYDAVAPVSFSYPMNVNFEIPVGYYTPSEFQNVFASLIHDGLLGLINSGQPAGSDGVNGDYFISLFNNLVVTVVRDPRTFRFTINVQADSVEFTNAITGSTTDPFGFRFYFWFIDTSPFIERGIHAFPFPSDVFIANSTIFGTASTYPTGGSTIKLVAPGITFVRYSTLDGYPASLYYSRYITVLSQNLSLYTFGESRVDIANGGGGSGKIVGIFATARYNGDARIGPYAGIDVLKSVDAPTLGIRNAQLKLNELIDFRFQDEFGIDLDQVFPVDNVDDPTLAFNITY